MTSFKRLAAEVAMISIMTIGFCQAAFAQTLIHIPGFGDRGETATFKVTELKIQPPNPMVHESEREMGSITFRIEGSGKSTPKIAEAVAMGKVFPSVEIEMTPEVSGAKSYTIDSGANETHLEYKLDRCFIKSWSTSGSASNAVPTEEITMNYTAIKWEY